MMANVRSKLIDGSALSLYSAGVEQTVMPAPAWRDLIRCPARAARDDRPGVAMRRPGRRLAAQNRSPACARWLHVSRAVSSLAAIADHDDARSGPG